MVRRRNVRRRNVQRRNGGAESAALNQRRRNVPDPVFPYVDTRYVCQFLAFYLQFFLINTKNDFFK